MTVPSFQWMRGVSIVAGSSRAADRWWERRQNSSARQVAGEVGLEAVDSLDGGGGQGPAGGRHPSDQPPVKGPEPPVAGCTHQRSRPTVLR